jgi:AAA-like domain
MIEPGIYTVGGTVQTNEQGLYIPRPADAELLTLCQQAEFAYVLTPRQMGKSSLMIRTAEQLLDNGWQVVMIDLALIGTQLTIEQWYRRLLDSIARDLSLNVAVDEWWQAHQHLGVTQRFTQFLQQVVLGEVSAPVVIFVDEIDTSLSLNSPTISLWQCDRSTSLVPTNRSCGDSLLSGWGWQCRGI